MHEKRIDLRWRDLDAYGHVNQAVYLTFAEEVLDDWFQQKLGKRPGTSWDYVAARTTVEVTGPESSIEAELKQKISKAKSINAVTDLMLHADTQRALNDLPEGVRDEVRDFAKARLVELGWPSKKVA